MPPRADQAACAAFARALPAVLDAPGALASQMTAHVETCLVCQAELARYRRLLRLLGELRRETVELPPGALAEVLACVGQAARRRAVRSALSGRPLAYGGGLAAAAAAAAGLVALGRLRSARAPARA